MKYILSALVLILMFTNLLADSSSDISREEIAKKLFEQTRFDFNTPMIIVDEQGNYVDDVDVIIYELTFSDLKQDARETTQRVKDGKTHIVANGVRIIIMEFFKKGYYKESLKIKRKDYVGDSLEFMPSFRGGNCSVNEIKVILRKKKERSENLETCRFYLTYNANRSATVFNLDNRIASEFENAHENKQIPPNCIYMLCKNTDESTIASKIMQFSSTPSPRGPLAEQKLCLQELSLHFSDIEGGFILFAKSGGIKTYTNMEEAPETGYVKELLISPDFAEELFDTQYFYFKTGKYYGKGSISSIVMKYDETQSKILQVTAQIELIYNTSGKRDIVK